MQEGASSHGGSSSNTDATKAIVEEASANVSLRVELLRSMRTTLLREVDEAVKLTEAAAGPSSKKGNALPNKRGKKGAGGARNGQNNQTDIGNENTDISTESYYDSLAYARMQKILKGENLTTENSSLNQGIDSEASATLQAALFPPSLGRNSNLSLNRDHLDEIDYSLCLNGKTEIPCQSLIDFLDDLEEKIIRPGKMKTALAVPAAVAIAVETPLADQSVATIAIDVISNPNDIIEGGDIEMMVASDAVQGNSSKLHHLGSVELLSNHVKILEEKGIMPFPIIEITTGTTTADQQQLRNNLNNKNSRYSSEDNQALLRRSKDDIHGGEGATWLAPSGALLRSAEPFSSTNEEDLDLIQMDIDRTHFETAGDGFEWPAEIAIGEERTEERKESMEKDRGDGVGGTAQLQDYEITMQNIGIAARNIDRSTEAAVERAHGVPLPASFARQRPLAQIDKAPFVPHNNINNEDTIMTNMEGGWDQQTQQTKDTKY